MHLQAREKCINTYVHGDDFVSSGSLGSLKWMEDQLEQRYAITTTIIGGEPGMRRTVSVLNRSLEWVPGQGIVLEADRRHVKMIVEESGCKEKGCLNIPATRPTEDERQGKRG